MYSAIDPTIIAGAIMAVNNTAMLIRYSVFSMWFKLKGSFAPRVSE
jgi:hypothetical protein